METHSPFQALDRISLCGIFSYLRTSDIAHLSLTCKSFHQVISTSPYILKSLFENLFARTLSNKDMSNLTYTRFQELLKDLSLHEPLPFFGFRSNGGCDYNNPRCLFEKAFEFREGRTYLSTEPGENFDIEGVLSEDYALEIEEKEHIQNLILASKNAEPDENSELYALQRFIPRFGAENFNFSSLLRSTPFADKIKPLQELRREISNTLKNRNGDYHIELTCQKMMNSIGLIQTCHFKREVAGLTCPVKTLVAFASLNEEIGPSSLPSLFSQCKTSDDLIQLLQDHQKNLPDINHTSIERLAKLSPNTPYIDREGVEFVVFNSNGKKQDVIPLFWANFNKPIRQDLFLSFKGCNFSGRYVMLKLIQCEDLRAGSFNPNHEKNIDMTFCCFYGSVVNL